MTNDRDSSDRELPVLIRLLQYAAVVSSEQGQDIIHQSKTNPTIALKELLLNADYVTESELKSLRLAEYLLDKGKMTEVQFKAALQNSK